MRKLFLDTSYIIALNSSSDQNHEAAQASWQLLIADLPLLVTTSYVLDETVTFFNSRNQHTKAVEVGERLIASRHVEMIHVTNLHHVCTSRRRCMTSHITSAPAADVVLDGHTTSSCGRMRL